LLVFSVRVTDAAGNSAVAEHSFAVRNTTGVIVESPVTLLLPPSPPGAPDSAGQAAPREEGWAGTGMSAEGSMLLIMGVTFVLVTGCLAWCVFHREDWLMGVTDSAPPSPDVEHIEARARSLDVETVAPLVGPVQVRAAAIISLSFCVGRLSFASALSFASSS